MRILQRGGLAVYRGKKQPIAALQTQQHLAAFSKK